MAYSIPDSKSFFHLFSPRNTRKAPVESARTSKFFELITPRTCLCFVFSSRTKYTLPVLSFHSVRRLSKTHISQHLEFTLKCKFFSALSLNCEIELVDGYRSYATAPCFTRKHSFHFPAGSLSVTRISPATPVPQSGGLNDVRAHGPRPFGPTPRNRTPLYPF